MVVDTLVVLAAVGNVTMQLAAVAASTDTDPAAPESRLIMPAPPPAPLVPLAPPDPWPPEPPIPRHPDIPGGL